MGAVPETVWSGVPIRVTARVVPRYAWRTTSIDVAVNGRTVLQTGGVRKIIGVHSETLDLAGVQHLMELSWGQFTSGAFPFLLKIDGVVVLESRVVAPYWWVAYWPYVAVAVVGMLLARIFS